MLEKIEDELEMNEDFIYLLDFVKSSERGLMSGKVIYLDTHIVVWLYSGDLHLFSEKACQLIEENDLLVSPLVLLELQYLFDIKRITVEPTIIFDSLAESIGLEMPCLFCTGDSGSYADLMDERSF